MIYQPRHNFKSKFGPNSCVIKTFSIVPKKLASHASTTNMVWSICIFLQVLTISFKWKRSARRKRETNDETDELYEFRFAQLHRTRFAMQFVILKRALSECQVDCHKCFFRMPLLSPWGEGGNWFVCAGDKLLLISHKKRSKNSATYKLVVGGIEMWLQR